MKVVKRFIDCDVAPFVPDGWKLESHKGCGKMEVACTSAGLYLNGEMVNLHLSENQKRYGSASGNDLQAQLDGKAVLNANVLDWLLDHREFIPKGWRGATGKKVNPFFWGTTYCQRNLEVCQHAFSVRCLLLYRNRWDWGSREAYWTDDGSDPHWYLNDPAAILGA